jgi:methylenetetrahydrofolate reductase (NADPH)
MVSVSFEFFPPKSPEGDILLWEVVKKLTAMKPAFCSVTYGAGGSTKTRTAEIVERIQRETGVPAASHLTCVNASKEEINEIAIQYWHRGIRRIVALRGDMPPFSS